MKKISILLALALLGAAGCREYSVGPRLTEEAVVSDVVFLPAQHGDSVGFSTSGHAVLGSVDVNAVYGVVFECQHGKFAVQGDTDRAQDLWKRLRKGDRVVVAYHEVFDENKVLQGRRFLGAELIRGDGGAR